MSAVMESPYKTELTLMIEKLGEEEFQSMVMAEFVEGSSPRKLAKKLGIRFCVLWAWLVEDEDRYRAYQAALVGAADDLAHQTLEIVDDNEQEAASRKIRAETRLKLASKWDRARYGEQTHVQVGGSVSLISLLASLPRGTEPIEGEFREETNGGNA